MQKQKRLNKSGMLKIVGGKLSAPENLRQKCGGGRKQSSRREERHFHYLIEYKGIGMSKTNITRDENLES